MGNNLQIAFDVTLNRNEPVRSPGNGVERRFADNKGDTSSDRANRFSGLLEQKDIDAGVDADPGLTPILAGPAAQAQATPFGQFFGAPFQTVTDPQLATVTTSSPATIDPQSALRGLVSPLVASDANTGQLTTPGTELAAALTANVPAGALVDTISAGLAATASNNAALGPVLGNGGNPALSNSPANTNTAGKGQGLTTLAQLQSLLGQGVPAHVRSASNAPHLALGNSLDGANVPTQLVTGADGVPVQLGGQSLAIASTNADATAQIPQFTVATGNLAQAISQQATLAGEIVVDPSANTLRLKPEHRNAITGLLSNIKGAGVALSGSNGVDTSTNGVNLTGATPSTTAIAALASHAAQTPAPLHASLTSPLHQFAIGAEGVAQPVSDPALGDGAGTDSLDDALQSDTATAARQQNHQADGTQARGPLNAIAAQRLGAEAVARFAARLAARASEGNTRFEMRLDPPSLGKVEVKLELSADNRVHAILRAERPETLQDLQREADSLRKALQAEGFDFGEDGLQFSLSDQGGNDAWNNFGRDLTRQNRAVTAQVVSDALLESRAAVDTGFGYSTLGQTGVDITA